MIDEREDREDRDAVERARAEGGARIPWADAKRELGLTDETKIEPVLSAKEWASARERKGKAAIHDATSDLVYTGTENMEVDAVARVIAVANDAYPDADRRKITRGWIESLRRGAREIGNATSSELADIADALESYLPSEGT